MANAQHNAPSGATPVLRVGDRYELTDRTGKPMGEMSLSTLQGMVRQGRLFRTDPVSKNGAPVVALSTLPELEDTFAAVLPGPFRVEGDSLRPAPSLQGDLDAVSFSEVLAELFLERRTGRLFVTSAAHPEQSKVVIFRQGIPINAMSNLSDEWIGEVLINHGLIDQAAFAEAVNQRKTDPDPRRIGSALVLLNKLSPRDLNKALSLQAMKRLIALFEQGEGRYAFVPDETAAQEEVLLVAGPRDIIETGLATTLSDQQATEVLAAYEDPIFDVDVHAKLATSLSDADRAILTLIQSGRPLSQLMADIAQTASLTLPESRIRVITLLLFGVLKASDPALVGLEARLAQLQQQDYFALLGTRRAATPDDLAAAYSKRRTELEAEPQPGDGRRAAELRQKIDALLAKARDTLSDPMQNAMYQRALQIGIDFEQPQALERLEHEYHVTSGRSLLAQQLYSDAVEAFTHAATIQPDDPSTQIELGWAGFLAGSQDAQGAFAATKRCQRALTLAPESDAAYLTIGKMYRIAGDQRQAEDNLRRAIELNPRNAEAQSELRLLFTRELYSSGPKLEFGKGPVKVLAFAMLVIALLFVGANVLGGGRIDVPGVAHQSGGTEAIPTDGSFAAELALAQQERFAASTKTTFEPDERKLGNVEFFWLSADGFWWARRIGLIVLGLLGLLIVGLKFKDLKIGGTNSGWVMVALPYGLVLGLISSAPPTDTATGVLMGMAFVHVLGEQIFFTWFLGRGLLKNLSQPLVAVCLVAVIYAVYQLSFYAQWNSSMVLKIQEVPRIGAFVGGVGALLLWRSGGVLAPFVMQLAFMMSLFLFE